MYSIVVRKLCTLQSGLPSYFKYHLAPYCCYEIMDCVPSVVIYVSVNSLQRPICTFNSFTFLTQPLTLSRMSAMKIIYAPLCSLPHIYNSQAMETTQVSINRSVDKKAVERIPNGILLGHNNNNNKKNNEILLFGTAWMDLECIMLSKISQTEKNIYHMISLICGI